MATKKSCRDVPNFSSRPEQFRARRKVLGHPQHRTFTWFDLQLLVQSKVALALAPRAHLGSPHWARPTRSRESMDVASEAEAGVVLTMCGGRPGQRALELAAKRIDMQQHQTHFRHTGIAAHAYSNCGREPKLTPE